jgi:hypothetical protein
MINAYAILVEKPEGKRTLGRPKLRWGDIRMDGWQGVDWMHLAQDRDQWRTLVKTVMKLLRP